MRAEELILSRLLCELKGAEKIALGPGLPKMLIPYLAPGQSWVDLERPRSRAEDVDLALIEALEVSESGHLITTRGTSLASIRAKTWIALGTLGDGDGNLQMVKESKSSTQAGSRVSLVVTDLGVIRVSDIGFELLEISPGVGSDDIRLQVKASLHVADDLKRIQLCA